MWTKSLVCACIFFGIATTVVLSTERKPLTNGPLLGMTNRETYTYRSDGKTVASYSLFIDKTSSLKRDYDEKTGNLQLEILRKLDENNQTVRQEIREYYKDGKSVFSYQRR